jgi:hypothetical protein
MNMKLHLGSVATLVVAVGAHAYAQPVVPADDTTCPNPDNAQCPQDQSQASGTTTTTTTTTSPSTTDTTNTTVIPPPEPAPPPPQTNFSPTPEPRYEGVPGGLAFSVGGGVDDFSGTDARRMTNMGGGWTARLTMGTRSFIAGEVSYIGSAQNTAQVIGTNNRTLYGNGAQGAVRLNALTTYWMQPFAYGGAAWRHYSLSSGGNNSDVLEIPAGLGIATYMNELMLDVRGEYRFAVADSGSIPELALGTHNSSALDRWGVTGNLGYEF